ncbi:hypothetical protein ACFQU1_19855 [Chelatococcus sp. GCM10030263]|uniref:hypothetical protein n=1 Tax=Chelatococcus sp. GCM10030263 TaxID=3273387 RepID=UPI00361327DD
MRAIEISDANAVTGAWIGGANIGRLDILGIVRPNHSKENLSPPLMDPASYIWPDPNIKPVIVDFSKAGKGIGITVPTETLQDWF